MVTGLLRTGPDGQLPATLALVEPDPLEELFEVEVDDGSLIVDDDESDSDEAGD